MIVIIISGLSFNSFDGNRLKKTFASAKPYDQILYLSQVYQGSIHDIAQIIMIAD